MTRFSWMSIKEQIAYKKYERAMKSITREADRKEKLGIPLTDLERYILNRPNKYEKIWWPIRNWWRHADKFDIMEKVLMTLWCVTPILTVFFAYIKWYDFAEFFGLTFVAVWVIIGLLGGCGCDDSQSMHKDVSWLDL